MDFSTIEPVSAAALGRNLRKARKHRKLSQQVTAVKAGIDLATLASIESGVGTVRPLLCILRVLEYRFVDQEAELECGPWLAKCRKDAGLSQQRLAAHIGVSKPTIIQLERGLGHLDSLCTVMEALRLSLSLRPDEEFVEPIPVPNVIRTPLRYPGGKSKAVKMLATHFPREVDEFREPFLGGGSVALYVSQRFPHASIWVNDAYKPLAAFWTVLRDRKQAPIMVKRLRDLRISHPDAASARGLFLRIRTIMNDPDGDDLTLATSFYIANRCSFSVLTASGSFSSEASRVRWTMEHIERLTEITPAIQRWRITNLDYQAVLREPWSGSEPFLFLDPPYEIPAERLYGRNGDAHRNFGHEMLRRVVEAVPARIALTYNMSKSLRRMYYGWQQVHFDLPYSIHSRARYRRRQKDRRELLLRNYHLLTGRRGPFPVE